jgi:hypothetical protein
MIDHSTAASTAAAPTTTTTSVDKQKSPENNHHKNIFLINEKIQNVFIFLMISTYTHTK